MKFRNNSYWDIPEWVVPVEMVKQATPDVLSVPVTRKQLEDWSLRLEQLSHEASDVASGRITASHAGPLDSDLLDLRDEIVHELHKRT